MSSRARLSLVATALLIVAGCGQQVSVTNDSGGAILCIRYYASCIDPIFHKARSGPGSCSGQGLGCHARNDDPSGTTVISQGAGGRFKVNANTNSGNTTVDQTILTKNYESARGMVNLSGGSPILLKPLAKSAGGVDHAGGDLFANISDADYQLIEFWISNQVPDRGSLDPLQDTPQCSALFAMRSC